MPLPAASGMRQALCLDLWTISNKTVISTQCIQLLNTCDGVPFFLPDGVALLADGSIVVADSGNDRICLLNVDGRTLKSVGGKGIGRYRFKEPVGVFISSEQEVYVADWHNHRVVVYDEDMNYVTEFGHYGRCVRTESIRDRARDILGFLKVTAYSGSYLPYHFAQGNIRRAPSQYSVGLLVRGLSYRYRLCGSLRSTLNALSSQQYAMNKPNGIAFHEDFIVVSQKNARCLSVYERDKPHRLIEQHFGPSAGTRFGRLGNILFDNKGFLYVCDEINGKIWVLDSHFKMIDMIVGHDSGVGQFLPFSCCLLHEDVLGVCGGLNFQIIDLKATQVGYCSEIVGELHSIAYNKKLNRLYIADRSHSVVKVYDVEMR